MTISAIRASVRTAAVAGAIVCGALGSSPAALAQPGGVPAPAESQDITVTAPEVVHATLGRPVQQRRRRPVEIMTTSQQVSFADLDLSKPADVATLRERIRDAAREACRRLDRAVPAGRSVSPPAGCQATASVQALAVANELVAAAAKGE